MSTRLSPADLAARRRDYHECRVTIIPILDHADAVEAELAEARASLDAEMRLHAVAQAELVRRAADLEAERDRLATVCREAVARLGRMPCEVTGQDGVKHSVVDVWRLLRDAGGGT